MPFLNSLEATGFTGDLVLFVNENSGIPDNSRYRYRIIIRKIAALHHRMVGRHRKWAARSVAAGRQQRWISRHKWLVNRTLKKERPLSSWLLSFFLTNFYMATARFAFYYDYLAREQYDAVFMTDISDVIFQGDIFSGLEKGRIIAFEENDRVRLGEQPHNSRWIREGYGGQVLAQLSGEIIYCSGTILGDHKTCRLFLKDFLNELFVRQLPVDLGGFDQGLYNYMISYLRRPYFKKDRNGKRVFTMGTAPGSDFGFNEEAGLVFTKEGHQPAVLHQYNRHPELTRSLLERYVTFRFKRTLI